jgi:arginase family enzyme
MTGEAVFFRTDDAWDFLPAEALPPALDVREEAKGLRFISSPAKIAAFQAGHAAEFRPFTLFGSGDFHHLSAVWTRQFDDDFLLLSFDNHPDWVTAGPKWSCGGWINRALENRNVRGVSVWGCGSDDCDHSERSRGARRAAETGRLAVHPWHKPRENYPHWLLPTTPEAWRAELTDWTARHASEKIYITIDLDCLAATEAVTNWDAGRFTVDDLVWALGLLRGNMNLIGGDLCGAYATPAFSGTFQRFASWWDHPKGKIDTSQRDAINQTAFARIWPALVGP